MLAFIEVYGYPTLRCVTEDKIKDMLSKAWEEVTLQQQDVAFDLKLDPGEEKKPGLLTQVLSGGEKKGRKVAFIHDSDCEHFPWTLAHEQDREYAQRVLGDAVQTCAYFNALEGDPLQVMEQAIADGNTIIFTTSSRLNSAALRCAVEHPDVIIFNYTYISEHRYIRTYFVRRFEAKFVLGAVARALAGSEKIGYLGYLSTRVEDKQTLRNHNAAHIAEVNAFALGAQMVNPRAEVHLEWYNFKELLEAPKRLTDKGIRLISAQDFSPPLETDYGLCCFTDGKLVTLAAPVLNWGVYYETLLRRVLDKSLQSKYAESDRALNYSWGMSAGVVDVHCSDKLPDCTKNLAEAFQELIRHDMGRPFRGKIYTQNSREMDGGLTMEQIMQMDWLVENVVGALPDII